MRKNIRWWLIFFTYVGSNISVDNSVENCVQKDISARMNKSRDSYCILRIIWKSNVYSLKTKVRLFNSNVIPVLLYGCQSCRVHNLNVFQAKWLRWIYNIFWPNKISNEIIYRRTNSLPKSCQNKKHIMRWLGHILRMPQDHIPRVALRWTPKGKKVEGSSQDYKGKI